MQIAIYSFLEYYPQYKSSIIVFDDQSNDGTKEWLHKENIKSITWSNPNNYLVNFQNLEKINSCTQTGLNASYRNSVMINDIFKQISTSYIMLNDADIVFLKNNWLEIYDLLIEKYPVIAPIEHFYYNWELYKKPFREKYIEKLMGKYNTLYHYDQSTNIEYMERLQFFHSIINLNYFKEKNLLFDNIHDSIFIKLIYDIAKMDTGSQFSWEIFNRKIPFYEIKKEWYYNRWNSHLHDYIPFTEYEYKNNCYIYHARWISSLRRMEHDYPNDQTNKHTINKINMDFKNNKLLYQYVQYIHNKYKTEYPNYYLDE